MLGLACLLQSLFAAAPPKPATIKNQQPHRVIEFSGMEWMVKSSAGKRVGPGPNYFGETNVWVDTQGRLHLKLTHQDDRWIGAEIISRRSFGFGTYRFYLDTPLSQLDPNAVLGLFTYSDDPAFAHREIDVECSRWSKAEDSNNAQFAVQPSERRQHRVRFPVQPDLPATTYSFGWQSNSVAFTCLSGHARTPSATNAVIREWTFSGNGTPQPGDETVRLNLWLFRGRPPAELKEVEVVISKFEFEPLTRAGR